MLKAAIRESARLLRRDGIDDPELQRDRVDSWLAGREAGHKLVSLATRLDALLTGLDLESLPPETHDLLMTIHLLDPNGDTFKYATVRDRETKTYVAAPRPSSSHVDVVAMSAHFTEAFNLLSFGVMTVLEQYADYQDEIRANE